PDSSDLPYLHSFPTRRSSDLLGLLFDSGCSRKLFGERNSVKRIPISFNVGVAHCWLHEFATGWQFRSSSVADHRRNYRSNCSSRSEEHTSELQSRFDLVCRLL